MVLTEPTAWMIGSQPGFFYGTVFSTRCAAGSRSEWNLRRALREVNEGWVGR